MNILLATYNFFPYKSGGSEVYVYSLAKYLLASGYHSTVIAALPPGITDEKKDILYKDDNLTVYEYYYDEINVWGVTYHSLTTEQIYSKRSLLHKNSWLNFFKAQKNYELLHINGFTPTIGLDLFEAIKEVNPAIKVISSYHTPISCTKGNLTFANEKRECPLPVSVNTCTACIISGRLNWPFGISKAVAHVLPNFKVPHLPASVSLKTYVHDSIQSFKELDRITDKWIVYSKGIQNHLIQNKINPEKIYQLRHGINNFFLENSSINRTNNKNIFLYNGRLEKVKGAYTLLKAWLRIPENKKNNLWITCEPKSDCPDIRKLINKAVIRKDIKFLGSQTQQELLKIYKQVHCVIIPSECFEIGPLVYHEAISARCNVIASDIGGCAELSQQYKNESTTFRTGNVQSLIRSITEFNYKESVQQPIVSADKHNKIILEQYLQLFEYAS
ncbi:MAG: glycosyltransferase [Bacteroidota bacterium]|nr:glycosyltransferase [Bacteroidota bacterium]